MAFNNNENGIDYKEMYSSIKPHFHFPLSPYYEPEESECLESKEEYLKRELEELKSRYHQVEKSMRWWADCTANWREKWSNVKADRNKLIEEITKYQGIIKRLEKENLQFRESLKTHRHISMEPNDMAVISDVNFCVENKISFLQEEVKRLSDLLNDARVEISKISQITSGDLCKQCHSKLTHLNTDGNYQNQFSSSISSESLESLNKNVKPNILPMTNNNLICDDRPARWRSATSGSGLISTGNASSLIVQTGCSHSSTMDQLSQKDDLIECPNEEQQIYLEQQMKTLSKQIEKLPNYNSEQE